MFGVDPSIELTSTALPYGIIHQLQTEDDLRAVYQSSGDTGKSFHPIDANVDEVPTTNDGSYAGSRRFINQIAL